MSQIPTSQSNSLFPEVKINVRPEQRNTIIGIIVAIASFIFLVISGIFLLIIQISNTENVSIDPNLVEVTNSSGNRIIAEIAGIPSEREAGLSNRTVLPLDRGMLFIFDESDMVSFWMKDTLIPLDIIFIAESGVIVKVAENTIPNQTDIIYPSESEVLYVLEINAGLADQLNYTVGERVFLSRDL